MKRNLFSLVVVCMLAIVGVLFTACETQKSSYQFGYDIDPDTKVDDATITQFLLSEDGAVVIYNEMKKTADQYSDAARTCIWKDSRDGATAAAKKAFQAGMEAVRKDNASFKGIVIRLYMMDPDTNKMVTVEKATI
jgi:hypothetical protein